MKDINRYVKPSAAGKWYDIGLELGVGDEDGEFLDGIESSCGDDKEKCFMEMIKKWLRSGSPDITWRNLLHCLEVCELQEAVNCVQRKVLAPASSQEAVSHEPMSVDSSHCFDDSSQSQKEEELASMDTMSLNAGSATQETITNTQSECTSDYQESVPMVPLYVNPPDNDELLPNIPANVTATSASQTSTLSPVSSDTEAVEDQGDSSNYYRLKLRSGQKIREYQHELAEPGIRGDNYIFVAPTGSGKTLVAAIVICEHLNKVRALGEVPKVVFMVNTKPLAVQQQEKLQEYIDGAKVECIVGDSVGTIKDVLPDCEIVVCTTGKFLDELKKGMVSLAPPSLSEERIGVSLLVMDECHHARKASPQAQLMHQYIKQKQEDPSSKLPQAIGLTASPGAGDNPSLETEKTIDHLVNLCALLDATSGIATVQKNVAELETYTTKPTLSRAVQNGRCQSERFISLIENEMTRLETFTKVKCSFPKWSQQYETTAIQIKMPLELSTNENFRDQISALKLLICYSQTLSIYMDLREEDALKVLEDYSDLPDNDETCTEHERALKKTLHLLISQLKALPCIENPLLKKAEEAIVERFGKQPHSRGVFFVHKKRHAYAVCDWMKSLAALEVNLKPQVITGHTRDTGQGMTQADQEAVMTAFRSGECNILVATSVAEEGLDVPACNFVIRFQHISNEIARAQTQGRARAEDSEVITIVSSESGLEVKEVQNGERLELVNKIISNNWFPSGKLLQAKLKKQQADIIQNLKYKNLFKRQRGTAQRDKVKIFCRKCKTIACFGSDVFTAEDSSHHVIPGDEIKTRLVKKSHHTPGRLTGAISKTHKIYCKKCDADWGIMCFWTSEQFEFPVLKCKSFVFQVGQGERLPVSQWSKAPFQALPLNVWVSAQTNDDDDDDDN